MLKRQITVWTGFNKNKFRDNPDAPIHKTLTDAWISYRYDIWKNFTWKSILNQTHKDWVYCLSCDIKGKEITDKYFKQIKDKRFFLTYGDTKQERSVMRKISNDKDEMINVRIDSDDMYHPKAFSELIENIDYEHDWYLWLKGYGYQYFNGRMLKHYKPGHSGPFFAHRYKNKQEWLNRKGFKEGQHQNVIKKNPKILSSGKVIVGIHTDGNSSTQWLNKCFKETICGRQRQRILKDFGLIR